MASLIPMLSNQDIDKTNRAQVESLKPVRTFLESKYLKSESVDTCRSYLTGLVCFNNFLVKRQHNVETILASLSKGQIDIYELLDSFVISLAKGVNVSKSTIRIYLATVRSYLGYHDIDIIPARFKKRVTIPQLYREETNRQSMHQILRRFCWHVVIDDSSHTF